MNDDWMGKKEKVIWLDEEMGGMVGLYVATKKMCGVTCVPTRLNYF